jgi:nitrite reductase (NADH) small subunit
LGWYHDRLPGLVLDIRDAFEAFKAAVEIAEAAGLKDNGDAGRLVSVHASARRAIGRHRLASEFFDIFERTQRFPGSISNHQTDSSIMAKLLKIAKTKDVPLGQAAAFTIEGQKIALFNVEGTYHAIGDTCTHRGGPLSEGDVQGTRVTCPWHGADFDLKTGAVLGPPAQKGVPSYKVVVEGDDIKVEV